MNTAQEMFFLIRNLAAQKGVTINKMLLDCGLGKSLVSDSERKNSFPTADKLLLIAQYLNVTTDYLLTGKDDNLQNEKESKKMEQEKVNQKLLEKVSECLGVFGSIRDDDFGRELAEKVQVSINQLSEWEKGNFQIQPTLYQCKLITDDIIVVTDDCAKLLVSILLDNFKENEDKIEFVGRTRQLARDMKKELAEEAKTGA